MKLEPAEYLEESEIKAIRMRARLDAFQAMRKAEDKKVFWRELVGRLLAAAILVGIFDYAFNFFP